MTIEPGVLRKGSWWKYWPCAAGGFSGPLLAVFLTRWLRPHFAVGVAGFVTWFVVMLLLARYFPPKWGLPAWIGALAAGVAAGVTGGVLAYLIHWP
jgi:hypothetical protein